MSNDIIGVRLTSEDKTLLEKVVKMRGEDVSSFVRRAIRKELGSLSFLSNEEKKALGMKSESPIQCPEV